MRPVRRLLVVALVIIGGALPWIASRATLSVLDNQQGLPLLAGQTLSMPLGALAAWLLLRRTWPARSRPAAALLAVALWLFPGFWLAFSDIGRSGWKQSMKALPSLLSAGPLILSVYFLNTIGLVAALGLLFGIALWRPRETGA